ncbi:hypothetical protein Slin15195_G075250 [Septoria linicola]|uniref:Uncharacterized protein n=1 Tax=Septoria linicola TaxID=215465 RepID=A0A9Q9B0T5_9PEZI|nr:hypothetical protein Slin15195_G075250 [Septoria linicola]
MSKSNLRQRSIELVRRTRALFLKLLNPQKTTVAAQNSSPGTDPQPTVASPTSILSLSDDLVLLLADHLYDIQDYLNLTATCSKLRSNTRLISPRTILRLTAAKPANTTIFCPAPHFLVAATARELGHWARRSEANEQALVAACQQGLDGMFTLSLAHCGLTLERLRHLSSIIWTVIDPVQDLIDKCVGEQWRRLPGFWTTEDDACTINAEASETIFHLAIYGELFGPDFETYLNQDRQSRTLRVDTRLEFIKYCVPEWASFQGQKDAKDVHRPDGTMDPRREVKAIGPYGGDRPTVYDPNFDDPCKYDSNKALTWVLRSVRWTPFWKDARAKAGPDFQENFLDQWEYDPDDTQDWRQRMWESVMLCQGLEGLGMIVPESQKAWEEKIKIWREKVTGLETEPKWIKVGRQATLEYPFLLGDLRICVSGPRGPWE